MEFRWTSLMPGIELAISPEHRFTTDSVLLSRFAAPRASERAVELGAGCGAVTLLWFGEGETGPSSVSCVELDPLAVALLHMSVEKNALAKRVFPIEADLRILKSISTLQASSFDIAVCNPPYFPSTPSQNVSPARRAARQEVTATIVEICAAASRLLRFGGRFVCCWRPERLPDLFEALRQNALEPKRIRPVLPRPDATPSLFLVEAVAGGKKELRWLAPLILTDSDGPSEEYRAIYRMKGG